MKKGLRLNGKMAGISRALHKQKRIHGGKTTVKTWLKIVNTFPQVSRGIAADLTSKG